jgi:hypothetical protein
VVKPLDAIRRENHVTHVNDYNSFTHILNLTIKICVNVIMEEEIKKVNETFNAGLSKLINTRNHRYKTVQKWLISFRIKRNHMNYITKWFNNSKLILIKKRHSQIEEIRVKYSTVKRALLVGINYVNTTAELRGCVNDVNDLKEILKTKYDYPVSNILTLTDSQATRKNILSQLTRLLQSGKSGDTLFFSFSGHGYFTRDLSGDELDGKDELIVTVDKYAIVDDELKALIDAHLKKDVTLIALFDNCHSGTILDLPYHYFKGEHEMFHDSLSSETKGTVICLSGCRDDQVSIESYFSGDFNGALTFHFIQLLNKNNSLTWKACVEQLREILKNKNFSQIPQISTDKKLDLSNLILTL